MSRASGRPLRTNPGTLQPSGRVPVFFHELSRQVDAAQHCGRLCRLWPLALGRGHVGDHQGG
eukprot:11995660-Alexandrium_andersonii.AAC.1